MGFGFCIRLRCGRGAPTPRRRSRPVTSVYISTSLREGTPPTSQAFFNIGSLVLLLILSSARAATPPESRGLLLDACSAGGTIFAVGERGALIRSGDSGQNWEAIRISAHTTLTGISFSDTKHGCIVGHDSTIVTTTDGGLSWTEAPQKLGPDLALLDVVACDPHRLIAVGAFGTFLTSGDSGRSWTAKKVLDEDLHLNHVTCDSSAGFFVAGERGTLLRGDDWGDEPRPLKVGYEGSFNGLLVLNPNTYLVYGLTGHAFRTEDNGATWTACAGLPPVLLSTAVKTKPGVVILAGQARRVFISRDDGRTFTPWQTPLAMAVAKLLEAPDGAILAFGETGVQRVTAPEPAGAEIAPVPGPTSKP